MGQLISRDYNSTSNDELINSLIKRDFIHTMDAEKVFRSVDRGLYFTNDVKRDAYRDSAWQSDKIHLSAPCVYATVLEYLELKPGNKFLNIGSGIGYFSTVAGLLLGATGVNHGIEIHQVLIDYAHQKMEEFKLNSAAIDYYDFCEPVFIQGNAFELLPMGYYDRVYCGAGVPPEEYEFMKSLINVGGILVMPLDGFLVQVTRRDEHTWKIIEVLEVTFTNLVIPERCSFNTIKFPPVEPLSLLEQSRSKIRSLFRENLKELFPQLSMHTICTTNNVPPLKNVVANPLDHFIRIQYGVSGEGGHILRSIARFNDDDLDAISDDEEEENNDHESIDEYYSDDNEDDANNDGDNSSKKRENERNQSLQNKEQASDDSMKRKLSEAGGSVQNETSTETGTDVENPKRMKMNKSPRKTESAPSTSSHSPSDLWETISTDSSASSVSSYLQADSLSWVSSLDGERDENIEPGGRNFYNSLLSHDSSDEDDSSESERQNEQQMKKFSFINQRQENELSKLLKGKIDSLPIPTPLKVFLNYNWVN